MSSNSNDSSRSASLNATANFIRAKIINSERESPAGSPMNRSMSPISNSTVMVETHQTRSTFTAAFSRVMLSLVQSSSLTRPEDVKEVAREVSAQQQQDTENHLTTPNEDEHVLTGMAVHDAPPLPNPVSSTGRPVYDDSEEEEDEVKGDALSISDSSSMSMTANSRKKKQTKSTKMFKKGQRLLERGSDGVNPQALEYLEPLRPFSSSATDPSTNPTKEFFVDNSFRELECVCKMLVAWRRSLDRWVASTSKRYRSVGLVGFNSLIPKEQELLAMREAAYTELQAGCNAMDFPFDAQQTDKRLVDGHHEYDDVMVLTKTAIYKLYLSVVGRRQARLSTEVSLDQQLEEQIDSDDELEDTMAGLYDDPLVQLQFNAMVSEVQATRERQAAIKGEIQLAMCILSNSLIESAVSLAAAIRSTRFTRRMAVELVEVTGGRPPRCVQDQYPAAGAVGNRESVSGGWLNSPDRSEHHFTAVPSIFGDPGPSASVVANPLFGKEMSKSATLHQHDGGTGHQFGFLATPHIQLRNIADLVGMCHALNPKSADVYLKRLEQQQEQAREEAKYLLRVSALNASRGPERRSSLGFGESSFVAGQHSHMASPAVSGLSPLNHSMFAAASPMAPTASTSTAGLPSMKPSRLNRQSTSISNTTASAQPAGGQVAVDERDSVVPTTVLKDLEMICRAYGLDIPTYELPETSGKHRERSNSESFGAQRLSVDLSTGASPLPPKRGAEKKNNDDGIAPLPSWSAPSVERMMSTSTAKDVSASSRDMKPQCSPRKQKAGAPKKADEVAESVRKTKNFAKKQRDACISTYDCKVVKVSTAMNTTLSGSVSAQHITDNLSIELDQERSTITKLQKQLLDAQKQLAEVQKNLDYFAKYNRVEMVQKVVTDLAHQPRGQDNKTSAAGSPLRLLPRAATTDPDVEGPSLAPLREKERPLSRQERDHQRRQHKSCLNERQLVLVEGKIFGEVQRREDVKELKIRQREVASMRLKGFPVKLDTPSLDEIDAMVPMKESLPLDNDAPTRVENEGSLVVAAALAATAHDKEQRVFNRGEDQRQPTPTTGLSRNNRSRAPSGKKGVKPTKGVERSSPLVQIPSPALLVGSSSPPRARQDDSTITHVYQHSSGAQSTPSHFGPRSFISHCGSTGPPRSSLDSTKTLAEGAQRFALYSSSVPPPTKRAVL